MRVCERCGACFEDQYDLCAYDSGLLEPWFVGPRLLAGRYILEQRVAAGAMGTVFRATHLNLGSTIAVKLMQPRTEGWQVRLARFRREAQILGQIKHPNAVLVMDFGIEERGEDSIPFLVTEFLRGESLRAVLDRQGALSLDETEAIVTPLCEAVDAAHQVGVIHRDLKPTNIFLEQLRDGGRVVKVLDFGIAKFMELGPETVARLAHTDPRWARCYQASLETDLLDEMVEVQQGMAPVAEPSCDNLTDVGLMVGTIPYMAPEQIEGIVLSSRIDVYALACLVLELLSGQRAFGGREEEILQAKLRDERPSLRDRGLEIPQGLERVLHDALARSPDERPASVLALAEAVQRSARAGRGPEGQVSGISLLAAVQALEEALALLDFALIESDTCGAEESYQIVRDRVLSLDGPLRQLARLLAQSPVVSSDDRGLLRRALVQLRCQLDRSAHALFDRGAANAAAHATGYLRALWQRAQTQASSLMLQLDALAGRDNEFELSPITLPQLDDVPGPELLELVGALEASEPLDAFDAFERLLDEHLGQVYQLLARPEAAKDPLVQRLVEGLSPHADRLLLLELFPSRRALRLLPALAALEPLAGARYFETLCRLYSAPTGLSIQDVELQVGALVPAQQPGLWACLVCHPGPEVRYGALKRAALDGLWGVILHPRTPIPILRDVFAGVVDRAPPEYLKVFFLCTRDRLGAVSSPLELEQTFALLQQFFCDPCFHEDDVFDLLLEVDQVLRERCALLGIQVPGEKTYDELLAEFSAGGVRPAARVEQMRHVPLAIQRKLARDGRFVDFFACHPNERVALEVVRHLLRRDDILRYLRLTTLHRAVLVELSRHRRFFRRQTAILALLQHPKTPAMVARNYIALIGRAQLLRLAANKHANAEVRQLAGQVVQRYARADGTQESK